MCMLDNVNATMATQIQIAPNRVTTEDRLSINEQIDFLNPVEHERTQFPRPLEIRHAKQYKRDIRQKSAPINWLRLGSFFGFDTIDDEFGLVPRTRLVLSAYPARSGRIICIREVA
jgi:hypothetical protein